MTRPSWSTPLFAWILALSACRGQPPAPVVVAADPGHVDIGPFSYLDATAGLLPVTSLAVLNEGEEAVFVTVFGVSGTELVTLVEAPEEVPLEPRESLNLHLVVEADPLAWNPQSWNAALAPGTVELSADGQVERSHGCAGPEFVPAGQPVELSVPLTLSLSCDLDLDGAYAAACGGTDCDDEDAGVLPGATELCDGIDQDCDGLEDEQADEDGDGWTVCDGDCDDAQPRAHPEAEEICDGFDDDCDGLLFPGEDDADGDSFFACWDDCDDDDPDVHPNTPELCDGVDADCDGSDGEPELAATAETAMTAGSAATAAEAVAVATVTAAPPGAPWPAGTVGTAEMAARAAAAGAARVESASRCSPSA